MGISNDYILQIQWETVWVEVNLHNAGKLASTSDEFSAKGHSNNRHICFCWQRVQNDNGVSCSSDERLKLPTHSHSSVS